MRSFIQRAMTLGLLCAASSTSLSIDAIAADTYMVDNDHTSVGFKIAHAGISWVHGRFNETAGQLLLDDANPKVSFKIQSNSVDTKVKKRDDHLRSADFFNTEKFPEITFESDSVEKIDKGLKVTGKVTLLGVTKPLSIELLGGEATEFPPGVSRIGYVSNFAIKRSDFGMKMMLGPIGDEVHMEIGLEAIKQ